MDAQVDLNPHQVGAALFAFELSEKFFLPCRILESRFCNEAVAQGNFRPFEGNDIVICSHQFARNKAANVANMPWHLVVIDEVHRLRNVYRASSPSWRRRRTRSRSWPSGGR